MSRLEETDSVSYDNFLRPSDLLAEKYYKKKTHQLFTGKIEIQVATKKEIENKFERISRLNLR